MVEQEEVESAVLLLVKNYEQDLQILRKFDPVIVNEADLKRLEALANKYGEFEWNISMETFSKFVGQLLNIVNKRLERFVIEDTLGKYRRDTQPTELSGNEPRRDIVKK